MQRPKAAAFLYGNRSRPRKPDPFGIKAYATATNGRAGFPCREKARILGLFEGHVSRMTPIRSTSNAKEMIIMADQTAQKEQIQEASTEPTKKSALEELSDIYDADVILAPE